MNPTQNRTYVPGVCNIGPEETKLRIVGGWFGLVLAIVILGILLAVGSNPYLRLVIFLPLFVGALGFLQAASHFCVNFGFNGKFNFTPEVGKADTVAQAEYRAKDKKHAMVLIGYSALIALIIALLSLSI